MAQLNSPGVSVTVIDESFYTPAAPGTVPLIIVASAESKPNAANTGTAAGTLKVNAGKVNLLTSQKELVDTFGTPIFYTDANNNPIHAGEMNEYGLQAAYSYLGVSNRAYVVRADIDLSQLGATENAPSGAPSDGAFWFDTSDTQYGIFEWNSSSAISGGQVFKNKVPLVITDTDQVAALTGAPSDSIGKIGNYAIVAVSTINTLWYKKGQTDTSAGWVEVGSTAWIASRPSAQGIRAPSLLTTLDELNILINGVEVASVTNKESAAAVVTAINLGGGIVPGITAGINATSGYFEIYSTGTDFSLSGTSFQKLMGLKDSTGTEYTGTTAVLFKAPSLQMSPHYNVPLFKKTSQGNESSYNGRPTGSVWIKTTTPNLGADWVIKRYNAVTELWQRKTASLYATNADALAALDASGGGQNLSIGTVYVKFNDSEETSQLANFKVYARSASGATVITSKPINLSNVVFSNGTEYSFTIAETRSGTNKLYPLNSNGETTPVEVSFTGSGDGRIDIDSIISAINSSLEDTNINATKSAAGTQIIITHSQGGDIKFVDTLNGPINLLFGGQTHVYQDPAFLPNTGRFVASLWASSVKDSFGNDVAFVTASSSALTSEPEDGALWYDSNLQDVDIMIHNGSKWVGYLNFIHYNGLEYDVNPDPAGPFVRASEPTNADRTDGAPELANGDLWIDTSDEENYPKIHRYDYLLKKWVLIDTSDQTTENGILFRDARWASNGNDIEPASIRALLESDYVDPDAPDPALYPRGMLLWNLRRSGFNVKKFVRNYINILEANPRYQVETAASNGELVDEPMGGYNNDDGDPVSAYYPHRWLSWAANQPDGSGSFGRKAQRGVVIQALQALINSNQEIRDDEGRIFNLIACPGYPELISEMITLNTDRGLTAFVVGDCPARLTSDATSLSRWGNNEVSALEDNDKGLVSYDEYMAVYYPWGYSSDNIGNNIAVPPSHMMLRTIALSDNVSYPWFAPAGTRRGGITNASAVGYINSEGEFQSVSLNVGQRDTLAAIKVNPITFINGAGIICYGQRTRARNASALDRINVARLVVYLRRQFAQLAKPYIFEPNDKITRDEIKGAAESLLLELVGQRALYDYIVVCDTSNNTPARIDRNELYLDVAIEPVKAVEFIYIPLRLKNTGTINNISSQ